MLCLLRNFIREKRNEHMFIRKELIRCSLKIEETDLFESLRKAKLLKWSLYDNTPIHHVSGMKWMESHGMEVANDDENFEKIARESPAHVMEYLMVEKGMTLDFMLYHVSTMDWKMLEMILRLKGLKELQSIEVSKIRVDFETVRFLKSTAYKFEEKSVLRHSDGDDIYVLMCFNLLKFKDLSEQQKRNFMEYIFGKDLKICKQMYPFMKEIRKKKIMTVILCIRKTCKLQKEIIWNILDLAYSPVNERGF